DSGANGVLDGLRAVSVGGDFAAELMRFLGDRGHFLQRVLRGAGLVALAEHATGGANLDQVRPVLDSLANFAARFPRPISHAAALVVKLERQQTFVAVSASDSQRRPGDEHVGTLNVTSVDAITESHVRVVASAHVADGGETGTHSEARILCAGDGLPRHGN